MELTVKISPAPTSAKAKLLDAALRVIRTKGYAASTVDDVCEAAGVSKGSFFHHFTSKEEFALAAAAHFSAKADELFGAASYHGAKDARERFLGYLDLRSALLRGELPDFTCLLGTMVQEAYNTHPAIREACDGHIRHHAWEVARDIAQAKAALAPDAPWSAESLALFTQAVIQGAFILAKAHQDPDVAADCLTHLRRYIETQLPAQTTTLPRSKGDYKMQLRPNLTFAGNAESALAHYRTALGGEMEIVRFAGTPAEEHVPTEWGAKVLYGTVHSPYGDINVMDAPPGREGTPGDNFAIAVDVEDEARAYDVFAKLAADGTILMPLEKTFFARMFGMANDKFGIRWMVNVPRAA